MIEINFIYIDDDPDPSLSKYLDKKLSISDCHINYAEIKFAPEKGYESLIQDTRVKTANIILIDSILFENTGVVTGKLTGEEFKIILKKYFPFIEVIVITQNEPETDAGTISKYNSKKHGDDAEEYYSGILPSKIKESIINIEQYHHIAEKLRENTSLDKYLKEKILNSINGTSVYDELTKSDIDRLISEIKEIKMR